MLENGRKSLYTYDEFIARILDELDWNDMPMPVSNKDFMEHFRRSVLNPFSVFCPREEIIKIGEENRIAAQESFSSFRRYKLPSYLFPTQAILGVSYIEPISNLGYSNEYRIPYFGSPDSLLMALSDVRMAASIGTQITRSVTTRFTKPDILDVYGGYTGCCYELGMLLSHDISLSTVPDTAFEDLYKLAALDVKDYFYSKLKRKDNIETASLNISLKIEDWANAGNEKAELLETWKREGYNLNIDYVQFFN